MDKIVYVYYLVLAVILFWGVKFYGRGKWNDGFMSLSQTKAIQGFTALCIMFHHIGQKTCAPWLDRAYIRPGLEVFVPTGYIFVGVFLFCSGYGLLKSYREKPNYLRGFFGRRMLPLIVGFYSTGIIFFIIRLIMGQKMDVWETVFLLTGMKLSNPNTWYVIALPILYLGFYLAFRFCKKEKNAIIITCLVVFAYTLVGTCINHNNFWMRGEWWYNCVHLFSIGLVFAKFEEKIVKHVKKYYIFYVIGMLAAFIGFYKLTELTQSVFTYYGEQHGMNFVVLRRWVCLISQMLASSTFVFFIFILGMKIQIGNRMLKFMGTITLEFYLIHGLYVELFGFNFMDMVDSIYYIKNVALFILVVAALSLPSAIALQKLDRGIVSIFTEKKGKAKKKA